MPEPRPPERLIGRSVARVEDGSFLRGDARFVADVRLPGLAHLVVVRSPFAHARLQAVDLGEVRGARGVLDVFTAADIEPFMQPVRPTRPLPPGPDGHRQLPLARSIVRYVGEPVAVVVGESRRLAEDAAALVCFEAEELAACVDVALAPAEARVHSVSKRSGGDVVAAEAGAHLVLEATLCLQRDSGMPIETRGLVAARETGGGVTLWGVAKLPAFVRMAVADLLGVPPTLVRVRPVAIGGGFGVRGELYVEDLLTVIAAVRASRPVAWIEDRREHFVGVNHSRESVWRVRAAVSAEGDLLALSGSVDLDIGAYVRTLVPAELFASELLGPYRVPAYRCDAHCCLTNKMGIGTMRSPGTYEAGFAREMLFDRVAAALGMAPEAFRRRNLLGPDDLPLATGFELLGSEVVYDSADLPEAFRLARQAIEADLPQARARAEAGGARVGTAVVPFILPTGIGPFESARLAVEPPGVVAVHVATTSMGQGHRTSLAQVCADAVGVPLAVIDVREGDPASVPASIGTFASRSLATAGTAVWNAGLQLRAQLAKLVGDGPADLARALDLAGGTLEATARFDVPNLTYAYGCHAAQVELDRELGTLRVLRYVVVADAGRLVNPDLVRDQVRGAAVLGIGGALLESIEYSADGQPLTTTFLDFLLPTASDVPPIEVVLLDRARSPLNPLGLKGAGEMGSAACGATIACAAQDALGRSGRWLDTLPLTPDRLLTT